MTSEREIAERLVAMTPEQRRHEMENDPDFVRLGGTIHKYALKYRPPSAAVLPRGWRLMERGSDFSCPGRPDLPIGNHRFGVVGYDRRLTDDEVRDFDLVPC